MRALVTGGAGFIGSHLADALLAAGHDVRVVDCLTPYYGPERKRDNLAQLAGAEVSTIDLAHDDIDGLLDGVDAVFHQAGQPGVRLSWAEHFVTYSVNNILATQRLLEACRDRRLRRFVFASSSSVYGDAERYPTTEDDLPRPRSPYGVTKLAAEHLCGVYASDFGVPTVALRYFTVYGPRQRPDMSFQRLCEAALTGDAFPLYGDGSQIREFTFVGDVVEANLAALDAPVPPGSVFNVSGGASATMSHAIEVVGELAGRPVTVDRQPVQSGDVHRTGGSIERTHAALGWAPATDLRTGLGRQLEWQARHRYEAGTSVTS
jgi:nucleoside-diphosphate-sugar epimerase